MASTQPFTMLPRGNLLPGLLVILTFILPATLRADDPEMLGKWHLVSTSNEGRESPAEDVKAVDRGWTITKDQITWNWVSKSATPGKPDKEHKTQWGYQLDPTQTPPAIDLISNEPNGKLSRGIYYLQGDTLKLCLSDGAHRERRPTEFESKAGSHNTTLFILKRAKP